MTLELSMRSLLSGILYSACLGAFFALLYDAIRLIRVLLGIHYQGNFIKGPFSRLAQPIEKRVQSFRKAHQLYQKALTVFDFIFDFIYFVFCGVAFSIFLYAANHGVFRFCFLFGIVIGFYIYRKTAGRLVFFCLREIASICYLFLFACATVVWKPSKWIYSHLVLQIYDKTLLPFYKKCVIIIRKRKKFKRESQE